MKGISLQEERAEILAVARTWFNKILALPADVREDNKPRTGIQILVRVPGTRNLVYDSVAEPSEAAKVFVVEKAVRSEVLEQNTSAASQDEDLCRYPGSLTILYRGVNIQVSISGLKSEEDVLIGVMILSYLCQLSPAQVCATLLEQDADLPDAAYDAEHYLFHFFNSEEISDVLN